MKIVKNQNIQKESVIQGGFSDIRLWPCYMIFSSLVLFLSAHIGMFASLIIVGIPAMVIAVKVASYYPKEVYDTARWTKDFEEAINHRDGRFLPDIQDYLIVQPVKTKQPKTKKTTKRSTLWPYLDIPARFQRLHT